MGGCEEKGLGTVVKGRRAGHRPAPNLPRRVTSLGSPSFRETLQDSLLLSCCHLKPTPTQSPDLGAPWAPRSCFCPYPPSLPGWSLSLGWVNLLTLPSGTDPPP